MATSSCSSGIAGISRVVNLPALAADTGADSSDVRHLVWIAQQRAPVYLPLNTELLAAAIPWLVPGTPRSAVSTSSPMRSITAGSGP